MKELKTAQQTLAQSLTEWDDSNPNNLLVEWCNNPDAEISKDGNIWLGMMWGDDSDVARFVEWLRERSAI